MHVSILNAVYLLLLVAALVITTCDDQSDIDIFDFDEVLASQREGNKA